MMGRINRSKYFLKRTDKNLSSFFSISKSLEKLLNKVTTYIKRFYFINQQILLVYREAFTFEEAFDYLMGVEEDMVKNNY